MEKTSLKAWLAIYVFLLGLTAQANGNGDWCNTEIFPQRPSPSDVVLITLSGWWGSSCVPNGSAVSVTGNDIYFDVIWDYPPGTMCAEVITAWERTESVGPLSPGTYTVYARLIEFPNPPEPYTLMTEFIVSGNPDIDEDGDVDLVDFAMFAQAWKTQPGDDNWNPACNISEPNDNVINERDLAVLADNWLRGKTGMTYQIDDCNLGAGLMSAPSADSDELRFSVTVQGSYIHFEDMMVANCCPDELALEMTLEDNLITIYETEYTPGGCWCICDYPVTATLGPFEPGSYTIEVYEDWGGFIGSTSVTID